jgi:hypothetical protein
MITPARQGTLKQCRIVCVGCDGYDFHPGTSVKVPENVLRYTRPGSIVVFHDSLKASEKVLYALPGYWAFREQDIPSNPIP